MKKLLTVVLLLTCLPAVGGMYDYEIKKAQESCESQQRSLLRERNGTPACDRVQELIRMERVAQRDRRDARFNETLRQQNEAHREQLREMRRPPQPPDARGAGHYWNHHFQRYCQHDGYGYATRCD